MVTIWSATKTKFRLRSSMRHHTGMHAENIGAMVRALSKEPDKLKGWLDKISWALELGGSDVVLLCIDDTMGRRATATAILLQHLLEALPIKVKVGDVTHLARPLWSDRMCGPCAECSKQTSDRSAYLAVFRQFWQMLPTM